jgi:hypothetical protein
MPSLPSFLGRPVLDQTAAAPVPADEPRQLVQMDLTAGIPAVIGLDAGRSLVLAVALGVAGALLAAEPLAVLANTDDPPFGPAPDVRRDPAAPGPRLTLVDGGSIADTVAVVPGVRQRLGLGSAAAVEVVVDRLVLTAGSLRSPGSYGSRISLRWRDLRTATDTGPPPATGDPALTQLRPA